MGLSQLREFLICGTEGVEHARDSCQDGLHAVLRSLLDMLERIAPSPDTLDALDDRVFAYSASCQECLHGARNAGRSRPDAGFAGPRRLQHAGILPVGDRSAPRHLAERFIEIRAVIKSAGHGHLGHAHVCGADVFNGPLYPLVHDVFHGR